MGWKTTLHGKYLFIKLNMSIERDGVSDAGTRFGLGSSTGRNVRGIGISMHHGKGHRE